MVVQVSSRRVSVNRQENVELNNAGSPTWSRLGELSTDIYALGLHRETQNSSNTPRFLIEARRRQFAAAYQLDKSIATFLGRPPRISFRYSDSCPPLDISDDAFGTEDHSLNYAANDIDSENRGTHRVYQRASWIRTRYILSRFRDEILELSLQKVTPDVTNSLKWDSQFFTPGSLIRRVVLADDP